MIRLFVKDLLLFSELIKVDVNVLVIEFLIFWLVRVGFR